MLQHLFHIIDNCVILYTTLFMWRQMEVKTIRHVLCKWGVTSHYQQTSKHSCAHIEYLNVLT